MKIFKDRRYSDTGHERRVLDIYLEVVYANYWLFPSALFPQFIQDARQLISHFNVLKERGFDCRRAVIDETEPIYFIDGTRNYLPMKKLCVGINNELFRLRYG